MSAGRNSSRILAFMTLIVSEGPVELELGLTRYNCDDPETHTDLGAISHLSESFGLAVCLADGERRSALRFGARLNL